MIKWYIYCRLTCNQYKIVPSFQVIIHKFKCFPVNSSNSISDNTISNFFANWKTNSIIFMAIRAVIKDDVSGDNRPAFAIYFLKFPIFFQSLQHHFFTIYYALSLFLIFCLRFLITCLPPRVLFLFRNPCTLFLCFFFGWYVRFILIPLYLRSEYKNYTVTKWNMSRKPLP